MTDDVRKTILSALQCYRSDDMYRAKAAFKNCTPAQMREQYGASGKTRQEILDDYEQHDARITRAVEAVKGAA